MPVSLPDGFESLVMKQKREALKASLFWCRQPDSNRYAFNGEGF